MGVRFRKQHPIDPYVVDFYASCARLIVEIDSEAHDRGQRPQLDLKRTRFLEAKGYRVVRIAARDVLADVGAVAEGVIASALAPLHQPAAGPPPRAGEDL